MKAAIVALITIVALMTSAIAGPSKVLVLPLDGNAPAAQRSGLNESVVKLSRKSGGDVTVGDTTFNETAAAVGCSPDAASCAEQVRTTLAVDELVYGSATTANGNTTVTVSRASAGSEPKTQVTVIPETDPASNVESGLESLFTPTETGSGSATERPRPADTGPRFFSTKEAKLGVGIGAGGVLFVVIGLSLWSGADDLQNEIDDHPKTTLAQINDLKALEDEAASKALWGNITMVVGLAALGVGGYFLWKNRQNRKAATITPAPAEVGTGVTLVLRGRW